MTGAAAEGQRLTSARSPVLSVATKLPSFRLITDSEIPPWLAELPVPAGWRVGRYQGHGLVPWRVAVTGPHPDGSWDACETISAYVFDGMITAEDLQSDADVTLRDLDATDITTAVLQDDRGVAVSSSGLLAAGGVWIRAEHTFLATENMLVHQSIFVDADAERHLAPTLHELGRSLRAAFSSQSR